MKGMCKIAVAMLFFVAACGRDSAITEPVAPNAPTRPLLPPTPNGRVVLAIGVDPTTGASIETNKDDYTPGEAVNVVGRGWTAGETVHLSMTEDPDTHADVTMDLQADSTGGFDVVFYGVTPEDLGVTFTLTATGQTSGSRAIATFTDGNISAKSAPVGVPTFTNGAYVKYNGNNACDAAVGSLSPGAFTVNTSAFTVVVGVNASQSLKLTVPATLTGYVFKNWSIGSPGILVSGSLTSPTDLCVRVPANNDQSDITINWNAIPVANAGGPYAATNEGTPLQLNGSATDSDGIATWAWTYTKNTGHAGATCLFSSASAQSPQFTCNDNGTFTVSLVVTDNLGATSTAATAAVTVNNVAPTGVFNAPGSVLSGAGFSISISGGTDVSGNDLTVGLTYDFDCGAGYTGVFSATTSRSCTAGAPGTQVVKGKIRDKDGSENEYTANVTVTVSNVPPTVDAGGPYSGAEGSAISLGGVGGATATDPDVGDVLTYKWTVNTTGIDAGGTCTFSPSNTVLNPSVTCTDDSDGAVGAKFTLTLEVKDGVGGHTVTVNADLTVTNALPEVQANGGSGNEGAAISISASFTDAGTNDTHPTKVWSYTAGAGVDAGATCSFGSTSALSTTITCTDDGTFNIKYSVTDDDGDTGEGTATVTVANLAPDVQATGGSGNEGAAINISASFTDAGTNDTHPTKVWSYTAGAGVDAGATCSFGSTSALSTTITCTDDGTFNIKYSVTDDDGATGEGTATVTVANVAPDVQATGGSGNEGAAINISASFTDAGSNDTHPTKVWSYTAGAGVDAGATCSFGSTSALSTTITCTDDGTFTIKYSVTDDDGDTGEGTATVSVANVAPTVTITSPNTTTGFLFSLLNGAVPVTATYTDPGSNDTHSCQLILDGDIDTNGSYNPVSGGTCSGSILPVQADVYDLIVNVKDDDGAVGTASIMIVVYDPSAGFVTGGGWIDSPLNALVANPNLTGKATFGFVSKYLKGATIPTGNTEFQFHAAGMNFSSTSYQFLLVNQAGNNAQFQGKGTINGTGKYTFVLWATDLATGDKFRLKITDDNNGGALVYDNLTDQVISSGSIIVHAPKK
jgi:PKD domain-containing protein